MRATKAAGRTVGAVARLAGTTVRTLHHYESIGLLVPSRRGEGDYRHYDDGDIDRLARILYYRELGFSLDQIAALLDDPTGDRQSHLARQRALLVERMARLQAMVTAIEREQEALMKGYSLTAEEKLEVFGDFDPDQYEDEAKARWGDTDAWKQSRDRTARYSKEDWLRNKAEMAEISDRFIALMQAGTPATSAEAMDVAEAHRQHISTWFYDCGPGMHRCLGEMYVSDHRFAENIDEAAPGLAAYMSEAILANADRVEASM